MKLAETVSLMNSDNYKERFKAEYLQLKERYDRLDAITVKYGTGTLDFTPTCPLELLLKQQKYMELYIRCLEIRALLEQVDLREGRQNEK